MELIDHDKALDLILHFFVQVLDLLIGLLRIPLLLLLLPISFRDIQKLLFHRQLHIDPVLPVRDRMDQGDIGHIRVLTADKGLDICMELQLAIHLVQIALPVIIDKDLAFPLP